MPKKIIKPVPNPLQWMRLKRGLTIDRLVELTGIPRTTLHRIESGQPIGDYMIKLATALDCDPSELSTPVEGVSPIPIIGLIRETTYIKTLPQDGWGTTAPIDDMDEDIRAIRVTNNSLVPHHGKNDILYFRGKAEPDESRFLEKECYVEFPTDGRPMLCWVKLGTKPGFYNLLPYASVKPKKDRRLSAVYPILFVKRG